VKYAANGATSFFARSIRSIDSFQSRVKGDPVEILDRP